MKKVFQIKMMFYEKNDLPLSHKCFSLTAIFQYVKVLNAYFPLIQNIKKKDQGLRTLLIFTLLSRMFLKQNFNCKWQ